MRTVFVAGHAIAWNAARLQVTSGPRPAEDPTVTGPGLGFLPIYGTKADAERENPGATVFTIMVPDSWVEVARPRTAPEGVA